MSPVVITVLVVGGIITLLVIALFNQMLENAKIEKARLRAELSDRINKVGDISETFPGQYMSPELKLLLAQVELKLVQKLIPLEKRNQELVERSKLLEQMIAQGKELPVANPPLPVTSEARAKDMRSHLEDLNAQLVRARDDGQLTQADVAPWLQMLRQWLVHAHLDLFDYLARQQLQQKQPRQAKLAVERALQYLRKQKDVAPYAQRQQQFAQRLEQLEQLILNEQNLPQPDDVNELAAGLEGEDDEWKKRSLYD